MLSYVLKRLAVAIPTLLILIVVSYVLMYAAPGGPFDTERALPPEVMANLERKYGLDQPLVVQIWRYVVSIVTEFDSVRRSATRTRPSTRSSLRDFR